MNYEKYIKYSLIAIGVIGALMLLPFLLKLFLPFILALIIAIPCQKTINFLNKRLKINRGLSTAFIVTIIVALISFILFLIFSQLFSQLKMFLNSFPETVEILKENFTELGDKYNNFYMSLSPKIREFIDAFNNQFNDSLKSVGAPALSGALSVARKFAVSLPDIVIFFFMFLLSTFFITKDYVLIKNFILDICPERIQQYAKSFKNTALSAFLTYIRAQLILMSITFTIVTTSLYIIGADYPFLMGAIIGLVDALPFFGTAIIIVPWAIISFIGGHYIFAVGLLVTQVIAFIVRQLLEPKIISSQIGLHPLITLISIYTGMKLLGVGGIIIGPIIALLLVNAYVSVKSNK